MSNFWTIRSRVLGSLSRGNSRASMVVALALGASVAAQATIYNEVEPNNSPDTANNIPSIEHFDVIRGTVTGPNSGSDRDYFRITASNTPFGIYRNEFVVVGARPQFVQSLEGQSFPNPYAVYYSFGKGSSVLLDTKIDEFNAIFDYTIQYSRQQVTPTNLGTFQPGTFRFIARHPVSQNGFLNMQLFDNTGRPVAGGFNTRISQEQFDFQLNVSPGEYFLLSGITMRSESLRGDTQWPLLGAGNMIGEVVDFDLDFFRGASIDMMTPTSSLNLRVGERTVAQPGGLGVYRLTVVPEPTTFLALSLGALALTRRNRSSLSKK